MNERCAVCEGPATTRFIDKVCKRQINACLTCLRIVEKSMTEEIETEQDEATRSRTESAREQVREAIRKTVS